MKCWVAKCLSYKASKAQMAKRLNVYSLLVMEKLLWYLNVGESKGLVVFSLPFFILSVSDFLPSYLLVIQQLLYNC